MSSDLTTGITEGKMRASHAISLTDFTVKSPSTEGLSRRFLECPICLEQYKNPKILPCYHSLCLNCLLQVASGDKITCPVCQQNHDLPPEGVKELPNCTILNDLLEFEENIATIHLCGSCKKKQAENFCVDCGILICNQCCETHRNIPVTKKHTLMSLEEYREEVLVKSRVYRPVVCPLHEGNQITYYCARCEVPVCVKCTESGHTKPEHGLETLSEAREKRQAKLQKTLERAQAKLALSEQRLTKLSIAGKEFAKRMTTERGHLEEGFQQMKTKLRIATEYLTTGIATVESEFQSKFDMKNEELARQLRQSESKVTVMSKCISDTTSLLQHSNEIGFLYVVNHTLKRIEQATNNDVESAPKDIDFEYSAETKLQNLNATVVDTLLQN
ncbi:protein meiotic P26-like [Glandiceps talaboti]